MTDVNLKVLIVDDSATAREVLGSYVEDAGYEPVPWEDPRTVVEGLKAHGARIVLLDMNMPERDGVEVLGDLHAYEEETGTKVCTIMVTGSKDQHKALKALTSGAFLYLAKPVQPAMLAESIEKARSTLASTVAPLEAARAEPSKEEKTEAASSSGLSALDRALTHFRKPVDRLNPFKYPNPILVFTQSPTTMTVLGDLLLDAGYAVVCVPDSRNILELAERYVVDVIVLDMTMETEEGLRLLEAMGPSPDERTRQRFLVTLTEVADQQAATLFLRKGAFANIARPQATERLVAVVGQCVRRITRAD